MTDRGGCKTTGARRGGGKGYRGGWEQLSDDMVDQLDPFVAPSASLRCTLPQYLQPIDAKGQCTRRMFATRQ